VVFLFLFLFFSVTLNEALLPVLMCHTSVWCNSVELIKKVSISAGVTQCNEPDSDVQV